MKAGLIKGCEEVNGEKWTDLFKLGPATIKFNREDVRSLCIDTLDVTYTIDRKRQTVRFENEARRIPQHKE